MFSLLLTTTTWDEGMIILVFIVALTGLFFSPDSFFPLQKSLFSSGNDHFTYFLSRHVVEGEHKSPVEVPFSGQGVVVDVCLLSVIF